MSKHEKILQRFLSKPRDFTYNELRTLLLGFGYSEIRTGRTSGSRVAFYNNKTKHLIRLHKPHPKNILKQYQLDYIKEELKNIGAIK
ncbi:MAG: type II toxin-antitoxin system HicA family toxin [Thermodesulfobacteriota bacterium]|nr:type II toxin-antitoxin system HicA family toxin [Thermodesulfobacteriota bacterium]